MDAGTLALMIPIVAILCGTFLATLRVLKGQPRSGAGNVGDQDETRLIQDIYQGLLRMEERVEALETLLLDRPEQGEMK
jgi:phage shock protein B